MYLIVGLGNPEKKYDNTRHNIGFKFIDLFLEKHGIPLTDYKSKFKSHIYDLEFNKERVILIKPQTYMNLSGEAVRLVANFYKIPTENILIICDDLSLPLAKIRLRQKGSSAGHNGLKDIEKHLGTQEYKRLKIGIGHDFDNQVDFVLGKFSKSENDALNAIQDKVMDIMESFPFESFEELMSDYN